MTHTGHWVHQVRVAGGKTWLDPLIPKFNIAARHPWVVFRDSDSQCPVILRARLTAAISLWHPQFCLRIAHSMSEAWLLADREGSPTVSKCRPPPSRATPRHFPTQSMRCWPCAAGRGPSRSGRMSPPPDPAPTRCTSPGSTSSPRPYGMSPRHDREREPAPRGCSDSSDSGWLGGTVGRSVWTPSIRGLLTFCDRSLSISLGLDASAGGAMGWLRRLLGLERRQERPRVAPQPPTPRFDSPAPAGPSGPPRESPTSSRTPRAPATDPWCDRCDMRREWCEHGLRDRRAGDVVFATRLGSTYHARTDCNALTVPRAKSLETGHGNSRMRQLSRQTARQDGLEPCRICMGGTPSWRR